MGSINVLVVGDDWREQLDPYIDVDGEDRRFRYFLGAIGTFLLRPGCQGWDINRAEVTAVTEGRAGSTRVRDIDFEVMQQEAVPDFEWWWDAAHNLTHGHRWLPWEDIRKKYSARTKKVDGKAEAAAMLEWRSQSPLQVINRARIGEFEFSDHVFGPLDTRFGSFDPAGIDLLLLPRADYVQRCRDRWQLAWIGDAIHEGELLTSIDINGLLSDLGGDVLLTDACMKV